MVVLGGGAVSYDPGPLYRQTHQRVRRRFCQSEAAVEGLDVDLLDIPQWLHVLQLRIAVGLKGAKEA